MKPVLFTMIIVIGFLMFKYVLPSVPSYRYKEWEMVAFHNTKDNTCENKKLGFTVHVKLQDMPEAEGEWYPETYTLVVNPNAISTDTISHEVYHMVQTVKRGNYLQNEELGAWMEGSFTDCVSQVVHTLYEQSH